MAHSARCVHWKMVDVQAKDALSLALALTAKGCPFRAAFYNDKPIAIEHGAVTGALWTQLSLIQLNSMRL